jgi:hypothetical protein
MQLLALTSSEKKYAVGGVRAHYFQPQERRTEAGKERRMMGYLVVSAGTATHLSSRNVGCCCPERENVSKSEIFNEQEGDTMEMIVTKERNKISR